MDSRFDIPGAVLTVAEALHGAGYDAVLVGGAVRDALRGVIAHDYDLVTDADPVLVGRLLKLIPAAHTIYSLGERFGTLGVALEGGDQLEITRMRPEAMGHASTAERYAIDASHRDFTINAIGLDLFAGVLLDPTGGHRDLDARVLRAPGPPSKRFAEDPLRVIRAGRFVAELGFALDPATRDALLHAAPALARVAVERIRAELTRTLVAPHAAAGLEVLAECEALAAVLPEVAALAGVTQPTFHDLDALAHTMQAVGLAPPVPVMRWAALLHDTGKAPTRTLDPDGRIRFLGHARVSADLATQVCERLRFSSADTIAVVHLVAEHMRLGYLDTGNPRAVDRAVRKLDLRTGAGENEHLLVSAEDALELAMADFGATAHRAETPEVRASLERVIAESRERGTHRAIKSPIGGKQLMHELRVAEGPAVGIAKRAIEDAIAAGTLEARDQAGALAIARDAVSSPSATVSAPSGERWSARGSARPRSSPPAHPPDPR